MNLREESRQAYSLILESYFEPRLASTLLTAQGWVDLARQALRKANKLGLDFTASPKHLRHLWCRLLTALPRAKRRLLTVILGRELLFVHRYSRANHRLFTVVRTRTAVC
jgi:hypothetical protein